ncbi:hypothetical protein GCM10027275_35370 [Rhabdobacter roseus]
MKLIGCLLYLGTFISAVQAQTLHLILVSGKTNTPLDLNNKFDEENIGLIATTASQLLGYSLKPNYLSGSDFNAAAVSQQIQKLSTRPEDIILFYYTGLGYYPDKSDFPHLQLTDYQKAPLSLDRVGELLTGKNVRLSMALADCRDTIQEIPSRMGEPAKVNEDLRRIIMRKLFLGTCGHLTVASARRGQPVMAHLPEKGRGSDFTNNLYRSFGMLLRARFQDVHNISLENWLRQAESMTGFDAEDKKIQQPIWKLIPCTASRRSRLVAVPSYRHSLSALEIESQFKKILSAQTNEKERAELRATTGKAFQKNALVSLTRRQSVRPSELARSGTAAPVPVRLTIEAYLRQLGSSADRIQNLQVDVPSIKRTPDFQYITSITITEVWKQPPPAAAPK